MSRASRHGELSGRHTALLLEFDETPDMAAALRAELDESLHRAAQLHAADEHDVDEVEVVGQCTPADLESRPFQRFDGPDGI